MSSFQSCDRLAQGDEYFLHLCQGIVVLAAHRERLDGQEAAIAAVVDNLRQFLEISSRRFQAAAEGFP